MKYGTGAGRNMSFKKRCSKHELSKRGAICTTFKFSLNVPIVRISSKCFLHFYPLDYLNDHNDISRTMSFEIGSTADRRFIESCEYIGLFVSCPIGCPTPHQ